MSDIEGTFGTYRPPIAPRSSENGLLRFDVPSPQPRSRKRVLIEQQIRQQATWIIDFCLGAATLFIFLAIHRYAAIIPWITTFALLLLLGQWWDRSSQQKGRLLMLLLTSYLAVSLVGMLEVSDNMRDFGTMFGVASDDSEYFVNARTILQDGVLPDQAGLYDAALAVWGYLPNLVWKETTSAFELLPLNWALAALVIGLSGELCHAVIRQRPPLWLMVVTLLGSYKFTDAMIHLYRDGLMLIFLLLALTSVMRSHYLRSLLFSLPILLLRGANFILYFVVLLLSVTLGRLRSRAVFYLWVLCPLCAAFWLLPLVGPQVFRYATNFKLGGYDEDFVARTFVEQMKIRGKGLASASGGEAAAQNSTLVSAMTDDSAASMVLRPIVFELMPIRFWSLEMGGESASRFASNGAVVHKLTLRNLYLWFSIVCWIVVAPLLIVGLGTAALGSRKLNIIFIYYMLCIFAVSFISFEMRHTTAFIVIHPLLAMLGYKSCLNRKGIRLVAICIGVLTFAGICAYNSFAGSLL